MNREDDRDCERIARQAGPFIDGELSPDERGRVESHLVSCERCAGMTGGLRDLEARAARATAPPAVTAEEWASLRRRLAADGERAVRGEKVIAFPRRASPLRLLPACAAAAVLAAGILGILGGPAGTPVEEGKEREYHADESVRRIDGPEPVIEVEDEVTLLKYVDF